MASPRRSQRRLMNEYAKDLRSREGRAAARRRLRTLRAFAGFLAPRRLEDAGPADVSEWSITRVDEGVRAERRAELADFFQWHRSRTGTTAAGDGAGGETAGAGPVGAGILVEAQAPPEQDDPVAPLDVMSEEERRRRSREPVHLNFRPPKPKSRYSWPKRLATAVVLVAVTALWMVTLILPDRRTSLTTTTSEGRAGRPIATSTTTAPMHPREETTVLAVNASGVEPRGQDLATGLTNAGFKVVPPEQAPEPVPTTTVYWMPGYEREARALAEAVQVPVEIGAAPMPEPPPAPDLKGANLVVVIGEDLAS